MIHFVGSDVWLFLFPPDSNLAFPSFVPECCRFLPPTCLTHCSRRPIVCQARRILLSLQIPPGLRRLRLPPLVVQLPRRPSSHHQPRSKRSHFLVLGWDHHCSWEP